MVGAYQIPSYITGFDIKMSNEPNSFHSLYIVWRLASVYYTPWLSPGSPAAA